MKKIVIVLILLIIPLFTIAISLGDINIDGKIDAYN